MFKKGEIVLYSATGICEITEITQKNFGSFSADYYVLRPLMQKSATVFVPTTSPALLKKMHIVLSKQEFETVLSSVKISNEILSESENQRRARFTEILESGDRAALIETVTELYNIKKRQLESGRRLHIADEKLLASAENLLFEEIAFVFGMDKLDAEQFIKEKFLN